MTRRFHEKNDAVEFFESMVSTLFDGFFGHFSMKLKIIHLFGFSLSVSVVVGLREALARPKILRSDPLVHLFWRVFVSKVECRVGLKCFEYRPSRELLGELCWGDLKKSQNVNENAK